MDAPGPASTPRLPLLPLRIEVIDDDTAARMRAMTPQQRLAAMDAMVREACAALRHHLKLRHPDWTEGQIRSELARRVHHGAA